MNNLPITRFALGGLVVLDTRSGQCRVPAPADIDLLPAAQKRWAQAASPETPSPPREGSVRAAPLILQSFTAQAGGVPPQLLINPNTELWDAQTQQLIALPAPPPRPPNPVLQELHRLREDVSTLQRELAALRAELAALTAPLSAHHADDPSTATDKRPPRHPPPV